MSTPTPTPTVHLLCTTCGHPLTAHTGGGGRCSIRTGQFGTGPACTCTKRSQ